MTNNVGILYSPIFLHVALNRDSQSKNHKRMTRILLTGSLHVYCKDTSPYAHIVHYTTLGNIETL